MENKSVALSIKAAKLTAKGLAIAMRAAYRQWQKARDAPGEMSFKQLRKGGELSEIDITHENIKAFDPIARKYGIRYHLEADTSTEPPIWKVYFRAKDVESMTAAFREFSAQQLNRDTDRPSVREAMRELRERVAHAVRDLSRVITRGGPDL